MRRTGIEDIKSLPAMIIQSERFGTSLSQALRTRRRLPGGGSLPIRYCQGIPNAGWLA